MPLKRTTEPPSVVQIEYAYRNAQKNTYISRCFFVVERGGFEPPKVKTDRFTVCCHWPLGNLSIWSWRLESNPQPADYKSAALPVELRQHIKFFGASGRNRTTDTGIFSPLLYRLSYRGKKNGDPERARTVDLQRDRLAF